MQHDAGKEREEASLIGRMLSMDGLILVMGAASLIYGIVNQELINIFWGVLIIGGFFVLLKVRKKDWKKHWEEMEAEHQARRAMAERTPDKKDGEEPK